MHPNFVTAGCKIGFNIADRVKAYQAYEVREAAI